MRDGRAALPKGQRVVVCIDVTVGIEPAAQLPVSP